MRLRAPRLENALALANVRAAAGWGQAERGPAVAPPHAHPSRNRNLRRAVPRHAHEQRRRAAVAVLADLAKR